MSARHGACDGDSARSLGGTPARSESLSCRDAARMPRCMCPRSLHLRLEFRGAFLHGAGGLQIFQKLSAISKQRTVCTTVLEISEEHTAYLQRCARELHSRYHSYKDDGWLQIASLTLSYLHTAVGKSTATRASRPLPYTSHGFHVCWLLAIKMYGAGYDICEDEVYLWLLEQPRATDGFNKHEMEYRVLELLDWQLNVATEHDLVGHLVGSLQPTIAAEIRDSTTISTRTSLELDDGWTLVQRLRDPSAYAVQNVEYALLQRELMKA